MLRCCKNITWGKNGKRSSLFSKSRSQHWRFREGSHIDFLGCQP
jgi:hypothetical protein